MVRKYQKVESSAVQVVLQSTIMYGDKENLGQKNREKRLEKRIKKLSASIAENLENLFVTNVDHMFRELGCLEHWGATVMSVYRMLQGKQLGG